MNLISICVPASPDRLDNLYKLAVSLRDQVNPRFELIVVWDGRTPEQGEVDWSRFHGLDFSLATSPRTAGNEHLPHRNHCRNQAARIAVGNWLFFCDMDMTFDPWFVEHAVRVCDAGHLAFSPIINHIDQRGRVKTGVYGGFSELYRKSGDSVVIDPPRHVEEGMPIVDRRLFNLLGGFDERFLGWGGNKVELTNRLNLCPAPYKLLTSARIYHNWHKPGPRDMDLVTRNQELAVSIKKTLPDNPQWQDTCRKIEDLLHAS